MDLGIAGRTAIVCASSRGLGKASKENMICTKFISEERFAGGVLACANHAAALQQREHEQRAAVVRALSQ